jgi:hypothetical protein
MRNEAVSRNNTFSVRPPYGGLTYINQFFGDVENGFQFYVIIGL